MSINTILHWKGSMFSWENKDNSKRLRATQQGLTPTVAVPHKWTLSTVLPDVFSAWKERILSRKVWFHPCPGVPIPCPASSPESDSPLSAYHAAGPPEAPGNVCRAWGAPCHPQQGLLSGRCLDLPTACCTPASTASDNVTLGVLFLPTLPVCPLGRRRRQTKSGHA